MTAADDTAADGAAPDPVRAETYLRLRAEHELSRALTLRRWQPPRDHRHPRTGFTFWRPPESQLVAGWSGAGPDAATTRVQFAAPATWLAPFARAAAWTTRRFEAIGMHAAARFSRTEEPLPAYANLNRVAELAAGLAASGVVDETTARTVVGDLHTALALRGLTYPSALFEEVLASRWHQLQATPRAPAGPARAIPIGVTTDCALHGHPGRVYLGILLVEPGETAVTLRAKLAEDPARSRSRLPPDIMNALDDLDAVDDQRRSYSAYFSGGGDTQDWDGQLTLSMSPPAEARWLDLSIPGASPVRIDLSAPASVLPTTSRPRPPGTAADRYIDLLTTRMLSYNWSGSGWAVDPDNDVQPKAVAVAAGLLAAGVLGETSPALGRLVAAASRVGQPLPEALAAITPSGLPPDWQALLTRRDAADGPTGIMPVGAVLPELDGAACVVTEIESGPEAAAFRVHARGWPVSSHALSAPGRGAGFWWSARDDVGGWYFASEQDGSYGSGDAQFELAVIPPINPLARALEITLTGSTHQVSVTFPLEWRAGL
ncbi:MAG TPA: hypothetical protein VGI58_20120 [Streptosporangiaceae bacterium]